MAGLDTVLDSDFADLLDDLHGLSWIPGVDLILAGIREAAEAAGADLDLDATQTLLTTIANRHGPDLVKALGLLVQHLTNPTSNPAISTLPSATQKDLQRLGEQHAYMAAEYVPGQANEAAGLIAPS